MAQEFIYHTDPENADICLRVEVIEHPDVAVPDASKTATKEELLAAVQALAAQIAQMT